MLVAGHWWLDFKFVIQWGFWSPAAGCRLLNIRVVENNCKSFKVGTVAGIDPTGRITLICTIRQNGRMVYS
jgi:hypothetical protein